VKNLLDKAIIVVIPGNEIADIKFNMSTLINLLKTAESEYDIGIENGTITNIAEYQDAQGFVSSANELFNKTINNLNETMANNFTEIKDLLNQLNTSMSNKEDSKQISTTVSNIVNTIPKILNIQAKDLAILVSTDIESSEVIKNIRSLLDQSIEKVKNSDYQNAETLVIEAYLDNFEFLEPEIAKHDESLMKDTEVLLREQLRNLIQGNANLEDIQKMVNNIKTKLDEIEKILE
jgi:high-affinity iron transporter